MDTSQLKTFAQEARQWLLEQVELKLSDVLADNSLARRQNRSAVSNLEQQIAATSRDQLVERVAYTWFNRFCALRYMDVNGYNRLRTVSGAEGHTQPEILMEAKQGVIDDEWQVDKQQVLGLLDNSVPSDDPQGEAYKLLLVGVCNSLHKAMPFLFEKIGDETELLLPANLLHTDSLIRQLVEQVDEDLWQEIEIIGWLYQFYISEKKDQVIGKVVKSEDIPAATQLFTPNWIVKYMVQNSLGAQWLATYPQSPLKARLEYYIEPAEQTDEVNAQLAAITPEALNPEELTLIDPASGSGHILVEAYELFKAIYLERGYRQRDVPQLILEKNLFGLDIDERAAQLTGFALMMKGRADDRRLFERCSGDKGLKLNVMALQDSAGFDAEGLAHHPQMAVELSDYGLKPGDLTALKRLFEHATTFGSLIQVPEGLAGKLPALKQLSEATSQDLFVSEALKRLGPLVQQAELLASQYDAVVANPPYMGSSGMNAEVKKFAKETFPDAKSDLFACFIERGYSLAKEVGRNSMVTMQSWMFLSSFEKMRDRVLRTKTITTLTQVGFNSFPSLNSKIAQATVFSLLNSRIRGFSGLFVDLNSAPHSADKNQVFLAKNPTTRFALRVESFEAIPGKPIAYWLGQRSFDAFSSGSSVVDVADARIGLATGRNDYYVRSWSEVSLRQMFVSASNREEAVASDCTWFPYAKGGDFRRWYGNHESVVNWKNDGSELQTTYHPDGTRIWAHNFNLDQIFKEAMSWTFVTSSPASFRIQRKGFLFDSASGLLAVKSGTNPLAVLAWLNSKPVKKWLPALNPTLNLPPGAIQALPFPESGDLRRAESLVTSARRDWDAYERSWDFQSLPLLTASTDPTPTLESSYTTWITQNKGTIAEMQRLEEENNRLFIDAYGLADELTPDVPIEQITLTVNPAYRYGGKLTEEEQWTRFRQDTMEELVSYAIGCMMGRYSLDVPGLILANTGESVEDYERIVKEKRVASGEMQEGEDFEFSFNPDEDNVIPILDGEWFTDDISERFKTFLKAAYGTDNFEQNLKYLEDGLYPTNATARTRKTIRDYLLKDFYGSHVQTYKKRPIYWLFSSPKGTFNALIYMHRYRPDTVSVVLNDYLREYQTKLNANVTHLQTVADSASGSQADKAKAVKDIAKLKKDLKELEDYERDVLYPLATQRLEIDLDDGVLVNYNKFGKALKKITGLTGKA